MTIRYALSPFKLQEGAQVRKAVVKPSGTLKMEDLVERIAQRGSTVGRADVLSVLEDLFSVVEQALLDGYYILTPVANFRTTIQGTFDGPDDAYDSNRHQIVPGVIPGRRLRKTLKRRARVAKQRRPWPHPILEEYVDCNSGRHNEILTPGGLGQLFGDHLKFDPQDPTQGIFLHPLSLDGSSINDEEATRAEIVGRNMPRSLSFLVPDLVPGSYQIQVRAASRNCAQVRTGTLLPTLTVEGEAHTDRHTTAEEPQGDRHPPAANSALPTPAAPNQPPRGNEAGWMV